MAADPIVIVSYARTPMGGFQGALAGASATELGAAAVKAAVERSGADPGAVEQILMGCVLPAGLGQAPARQAALKAGLPQSVEATTVNKMCGSGMQAAILAHDLLAAGSADVGRDFFEERDDVVVRALFVFPHLLDIVRGLGADDLRVLSGDDADLRHAFAGEHFNFEPVVKLGLFTPKRGHLGPGITGDHEN